jgi:hypothetical protein
MAKLIDFTIRPRLTRHTHTPSNTGFANFFRLVFHFHEL